MPSPSEACPTCEQGALLGITPTARGAGVTPRAPSGSLTTSHKSPPGVLVSKLPLWNQSLLEPNHPPPQKKNKKHWKTPSCAKERFPPLHQRQVPSISRVTSPGSRAWCPLAKPTSRWCELWGTSTIWGEGTGTAPGHLTEPPRHSSPTSRACTPQNQSRFQSLHLRLEGNTHTAHRTRRFPGDRRVTEKKHG